MVEFEIQEPFQSDSIGRCTRATLITFQLKSNSRRCFTFLITITVMITSLTITIESDNRNRAFVDFLLAPHRSRPCSTTQRSRPPQSPRILDMIYTFNIHLQTRICISTFDFRACRCVQILLTPCRPSPFGHVHDPPSAPPRGDEFLASVGDPVLLAACVRFPSLTILLELLRRSKTSCNTLEVALGYFESCGVRPVHHRDESSERRTNAESVLRPPCSSD